MRKISILIILLFLSATCVYGYNLTEPLIQNYLSNALCLNCTLDNPTFINFSGYNGTGNSTYIENSYYYNNSSGTLNHAELSNLSWSVSGHTIDEDINFNEKYITNIDHNSQMGISNLGYMYPIIDLSVGDNYTQSLQNWAHVELLSNIIDHTSDIELSLGAGGIESAHIALNTYQQPYLSIYDSSKPPGRAVWAYGSLGVDTTGVTQNIIVMTNLTTSKTLHFTKGILTSIT